MSADSGIVTRIRPPAIDSRSAQERIYSLQGQMDAELSLASEQFVTAIKALAQQADEMAAYPLSPGIRDEAKRLVDHLRGVADRIDAIRSRA